jgi:hypothetical protein
MVLSAHVRRNEDEVGWDSPAGLLVDRSLRRGILESDATGIRDRAFIRFQPPKELVRLERVARTVTVFMAHSPG